MDELILPTAHYRCGVYQKRSLCVQLQMLIVNLVTALMIAYQMRVG